MAIQPRNLHPHNHPTRHWNRTLDHTKLSLEITIVLAQLPSQSTSSRSTLAKLPRPVVRLKCDKRTDHWRLSSRLCWTQSERHRLFQTTTNSRIRSNNYPGPCRGRSVDHNHRNILAVQVLLRTKGRNPRCRGSRRTPLILRSDAKICTPRHARTLSGINNCHHGMRSTARNTGPRVSFPRQRRELFRWMGRLSYDHSHRHVYCTSRPTTRIRQKCAGGHNHSRDSRSGLWRSAGISQLEHSHTGPN
jgi:hypothetical protein